MVTIYFINQTYSSDIQVLLVCCYSLTFISPTSCCDGIRVSASMLEVFN